MQAGTSGSHGPTVETAVIAGFVGTPRGASRCHAPGGRRTTARARSTAAENAVVFNSAACEALSHVARARDALASNLPGKAGYELDRALVLFHIVEASQPSSPARARIRALRTRLRNGESLGVTHDLAALFRALQRLTGDAPTEEAIEHVDNAKALLRANERDKADFELQAADATLVYEEIALPLDAARYLVRRARAALNTGKLATARKLLKAAEDHAVLLTIALHEPLAEAHQSLWRALRSYNARDYAGARDEIHRAIGYLDYASDGADGATRDIADALSRDARSIENELGSQRGDIALQLAALWRRVKALSEREVECFAIGWQTPGMDTDFRSNLIEAKLRLACAQVDRFVMQDLAQATREVGQAKLYLDRSLIWARSEDTTSVSTLRNEAERLTVETNETDQRLRFSVVVSQLNRMIQRVS